SIDPDNISPLLNLATVMREGAKTGAGTAAKISAQLTAWGKAGVNSWTLSDTSGFVLKPEDFIPAKWYWASSGIPLGGADRFNEYLDKIEDPAVIDALRPRTPVKAEMIAEAFRQQLAAVPDPAGDYYLNCAQVFLLENETARAQAAVAAAEAAGGANPEQLARLKAGILTASGNKNDAVAALESAKTSENAAKILETLAATHFISGDTDGFQRAVAELAALPDAPPWAADLLAASKAAAENPAAALVAAERMMDVNPKPLFAVSLALNIAWTSRDLAKADKFAREMLNINPRDFLANYVRAGCFMAEKKTAEAERHYAAAVTVNPVWFALNDFAALLTDLGKYEPALKLAEQALKTGGGEIAAVWDTYATVLRKTGKTDEAWDAYKTAVEKTGGEDPRIHLNVAEMALERKDTATAKKSLAVIDADKDSLSIDERERLGKIRAKLR
ncbi:MAG: hypothetical protein FWG05_03725, partial [Kiritimatiellaeota bacterium]|nr:hypothetical protein [Kiritimatiellota bacterium]